ncbi:transcriptional regulator [Alteraurantiacibacter buctensis]|uniref:Helix-turn-helix domain-containing protein n=1 Tax=Alteraurantiacibacter buctensis TaxID=1503981 RepID=A0A844Z2W4_9SPHN|nr:YdaS family helix-turn-helix protein [Alteraurantiacibacter buctensis]MXO73546.1 hypothetical protein [Alteraurantiacibacter buctensis]
MVDVRTPLEALDLAARLAGSQAALARICDLSPTAVWKWMQSSKRLPAEYVLRVEAATGVSRHDLRPDIYPREEMIDHHVGDRFCGIDRQIAARQQMAAGATSASKAA